MDRRGSLGASALVTRRPWAALGLVAGPAAFISGWVVGGARTPDYSPVNDAISRIAAVGAPNRELMTTAFVAYGAAVIVGQHRAAQLRRCTAAGALAAVNGAATIGVAALPLEHSAVDGHAGTASPPASGTPRSRRCRSCRPGRCGELGYGRAANLAIAGGVTSGVCLVATTVSDANGFFQRLGLTVGDVWLVATGLASVPAASRRR